MNTLLEDGLGLMVLGMGFVFLFLVILIVATSYMSSFLNKHFPEAEPVIQAKKFATPAPAAGSVDATLTAVITAAIHQHRAKSK